jgi:NAD(P)-dependent dehydrogenase (short-subunit alcohol dehydrogenase family)
MRFENKVVVVTGGSRGIGRSVVDLFAKEGALVAINGTRAETVDRAVEQVRATGGKVFGVVGDVADRETVRNNVAEVIDRCGRIDILVNNAGITAPSSSESYSQFDRVMAVNVGGAFHWSQSVATLSMIPNNGGVIINVSSLGGLQAIRDDVGYITSKHAMVGLTRSLSLDWARFNIRVNCLAPGITKSEMIANFSVVDPAQYASMCANIPMGRVAEPEEQAKALLFLASDDASYITGLVMTVDGGLMNVI